MELIDIVAVLVVFFQDVDTAGEDTFLVFEFSCRCVQCRDGVTRIA
jgi:hypothetical protein